MDIMGFIIYVLAAVVILCLFWLFVDKDVLYPNPDNDRESLLQKTQKKHKILDTEKKAKEREISIIHYRKKIKGVFDQLHNILEQDEKRIDELNRIASFILSHSFDIKRCATCNGSTYDLVEYNSDYSGIHIKCDSCNKKIWAKKFDETKITFPYQEVRTEFINNKFNLNIFDQNQEDTILKQFSTKLIQPNRSFTFARGLIKSAGEWEENEDFEKQNDNLQSKRLSHLTNIRTLKAIYNEGREDIINLIDYVRNMSKNNFEGIEFTFFNKDSYNWEEIYQDYFKDLLEEVYNDVFNDINSPLSKEIILSKPLIILSNDITIIGNLINKNDSSTPSNRQTIPQDVKDKVWNRDDGECVECGSNENLEFDHIIPVSKGGANTYRNLQLLCEPCNRSKRDNIG